jgi:hypothetical protein
MISCNLHAHTSYNSPLHCHYNVHASVLAPQLTVSHSEPDSELIVSDSKLTFPQTSPTLDLGLKISCMVK